MSPVLRSPRLILLFPALLWTGMLGSQPARAASGETPPRVVQGATQAVDQILRENAVFFGILITFSYTAAIADPAWGIDVKDINVNLITREVRDARGHQLVRVRVAGVVRKNNNVELNILNPQGELVGKGFLGYDSGQLTFYDPEDRPLLDGYVDFQGNYLLRDLRLPPGERAVAEGYVDPCFDCDSLGYAWYDQRNVQVGGGWMYPSFRYNEYSVQSARVYWTFEHGKIGDNAPATGEAEYDLDSEATGAINSALFDTDRSAESFFADPRSLVPDPAGRALLPRFTNETGVAVTNTSGREIPVTYVARHPDGSLITADGIENPVTYIFSAGQQFAAYPEEIFGGLNSQDRRPILVDGDVGWMEIYSPEGDIQAMFLDGDRSGTALDGNIGAEVGESTIIFPNLRLKPDEVTEIELLNLSYDSIFLRLQLLDREGTTLREEPDFFVAGYGMRSFMLGGGSQLLRVDDLGRAASLRVSCSNTESSGCAKILGLATCTDRFGSLASAYAVSESSAGAVLLGPHLVTGAAGDGSWQSAVRVTRFGGGTAPVYLDFYDVMGNLLITSQKLLAPGGQADFELNGTTLPWGDRFTTGYVRVRSDSGSIAGTVTIGWSDAARSQSSEYPLSNSLSDTFQFNQVAEGKAGNLEYWTGLALLNDVDSEVAVTVRIYRPDGTEDRVSEIVLAPYQQRASLLTGLMNDPQYARMGGYLRVASDRPIAALVFYGDSSGSFLSAVPGIPR